MIISKTVLGIFEKGDKANYLLFDKIDSSFDKLYNAELNGFDKATEKEYKLLLDFRLLIDYLNLISLELDNTQSTKRIADYPLAAYRDYFMCVHNFDIDPILDGIYYFQNMVPLPPTDEEIPSITTGLITYRYIFSTILLSEDNAEEYFSAGLSSSKTINVEYNGNLGYIYFAIPKSAGALISILDPNGLEFINAFYREEWDIYGETHYVYWLGETKCNDDIYKFIR